MVRQWTSCIPCWVDRVYQAYHIFDFCAPIINKEVEGQQNLIVLYRYKAHTLVICVPLALTACQDLCLCKAALISRSWSNLQVFSISMKIQVEAHKDLWEVSHFPLPHYYLFPFSSFLFLLSLLLLGLPTSGLGNFWRSSGITTDLQLYRSVPH